MTATGERVEFVVAPAGSARARPPGVGGGPTGHGRGRIGSDGPDGPDGWDGRRWSDGPADLAEFDGWDRPDHPDGGPRHRRRPVLVVAGAIAVVVLFVAGVRWWSGPAGPIESPTARPSASAPGIGTTSLVTAGQPQLPVTIGRPVDVLAAASGVDVVWVLGADGAIARLTSGQLDATSNATDRIEAVALSPDDRTLFAATAGDRSTLLILDPVSLAVRQRVPIDRPVSALAATLTSVWVASNGQLQARTSDLQHVLAESAVAGVQTWQRLHAAPPDGSYVIPADGLPLGLTVDGLGADATGGLQLVTATVQPDGSVTVVPSVALTGPVSYVTGPSLLVARVRNGVTMVDRLAGAPGPAWGPFPIGASIWPVGAGSARWALALTGSAGLTCFGANGSRVGSAIVGDTGAGLTGPVVATDRAFYAVTAAGVLARGGRGACR